jgi:hypothetical protein
LLEFTDPTDRQLFFSSTVIQVRNGKSTPFWEARWLQGVAPKDLAPNLYKIAEFKSRIANTELQNSRWTSNLADISSTQQMEEFIMLFTALAPVSLIDQLDLITWNWTMDGQYTITSAYECQFLGALQKIPSSLMWKATQEVSSSLGLLYTIGFLHQTICGKNWSCEETCSFCLCLFESANHLLLHCNYTEAV